VFKLYYLLLGIYILSCIVLILFVLLQPSKSDASQVFGGGASSAAFGPRNTQTVLAKITITAAIVFFLTAFLFSIPGLFDRRSAGESLPAESAPAAPVSAPPVTDTPAPPVTTTESQPAASPPADNKPAATDSKKPDEKKGKPAPNKNAK
jgi:preprotein translocase subunit SecG